MLTLREAMVSDYPAIARLRAESWQQTYRGILTDTPPATGARKAYERLGAKYIETVEKLHPDGITSSATCRYAWDSLDIIA